jgi:hypothetical protein
MEEICNATIGQIKSDYPELKVADDCPVCSRKIGLHGKGKNHVHLQMSSK